MLTGLIVVFISKSLKSKTSQNLMMSISSYEQRHVTSILRLGVFQLSCTPEMYVQMNTIYFIVLIIYHKNH